MPSVPTPHRRLTLQGLKQALGPGILLASAAIGGSHLVASTQAGALYGLGLLGLLLAANLFKYPFLLVGSRFTAATGLSLLEGYQRQSSWYLLAYLLVTLSTGIANIAAVTAVAASLASVLLPGTAAQQPVVLLLLCLMVLLLGHYRTLDRLTKWVVSLLVVSTLFAASATLMHGPSAPYSELFSPSPWTWTSLPFLVALMGWMPCPLDLSAWTSLWIAAKERDTGHRSSLKAVEADFNLGYGATVVMAVLFLILGAWVMHGTGVSLAPEGGAFAKQLIHLFTANLGSWSAPLIAVAAFTTMFSTTLTCLDGYPRSAAASIQILRGQSGAAVYNQRQQQLWMLLHFAMAAAVLLWWSGSLGSLVTTAMWVSFVTTPLLAWMNLQVMQGSLVAPHERFGPTMLLISRIGLLFLSLFVVLFAVSLVS